MRFFSASHHAARPCATRQPTLRSCVGRTARQPCITPRDGVTVHPIRPSPLPPPSSSSPDQRATPVGLSAGYGAVCTLLRHKADPEAKDNDGGTPLHTASYNGHTRLAQRLVKAHADPNSIDLDGASPLHLASYGGHSALCRALAVGRADPNLQDGRGYTPLHVAAECGDELVCRALIMSGGLNGVVNDAGELPSDLTPGVRS